jgi:molybdopterin synthase catalytic subunit
MMATALCIFRPLLAAEIVMEFRISTEVLQPDVWRQQLEGPASGGFVSFEGWVRNRNDGQDVVQLEYQAYERLALKEGARILAEAKEQFPFEAAACVHRVGALEIGDLAVWVAVSSVHRDEAFKACRYIIDEVKHRVPIWKKEHYVSGDSGWVNCEACAATATHAHD